jgi:hypothetical protein
VEGCHLDDSSESAADFKGGHIGKDVGWNDISLPQI